MKITRKTIYQATVDFRKLFCQTCNITSNTYHNLYILICKHATHITTYNDLTLFKMQYTSGNRKLSNKSAHAMHVFQETINVICT